MELKILILSHGRLCEEIISSSEMIVGKNDNLIAIPLLNEDDQDSFIFKIKAVLDHFKEHPFLIIVDVMGGTPFNCAMRLMKEYTFNLVTGLCLAMLLEAYFLRTENAEEAAEVLLSSSKQSLLMFNNKTI